jgi:hypothetical protein
MQPGGGAGQPLQPPPDTEHPQGNPIVVVTTRTGLGELLQRSEGVDGDAPEPDSISA